MSGIAEKIMIAKKNNKKKVKSAKQRLKEAEISTKGVKKAEEEQKKLIISFVTIRYRILI